MRLESKEFFTAELKVALRVNWLILTSGGIYCLAH